MVRVVNNLAYPNTCGLAFPMKGVKMLNPKHIGKSSVCMAFGWVFKEWSFCRSSASRFLSEKTMSSSLYNVKTRRYSYLTINFYLWE